MNCLKCKKETEDTNVFCQDCLQVMERYPITREAIVHLPQRQSRVQDKQQLHKKELSPEDMVPRLRGVIKALTAVIGGMAIILAIISGMLLNSLNRPEQESNIGRNYTTDTSQQP